MTLKRKRPLLTESGDKFRSDIFDAVVQFGGDFSSGVDHLLITYARALLSGSQCTAPPLPPREYVGTLKVGS